MAKQTILCVDDEQHILDLLSYNLEAADYSVITATTGADALSIISSARPALILLDLMLPDANGIEICRKLKSNTATASIPIIILTAKGDELDKILGLEIGADDYVTKPFSVRELVARVKAMLRRATTTDSDGVIRNGPLTIDCSSYEAFRNGEEMQLTLKEFEVLRLLGQYIGRVVTRDVLLDRVWGYEFMGETRTVDVHIRHLRAKLGEDQKLIETVRGVGYKMVKAE